MASEYLMWCSILL